MIDRKYVILILIQSFLWPFPAIAQVSLNANDGVILVGESSDTCNGSLGGALRYDKTAKKMQYCDTTAWRNFPEKLGDLADVSTQEANTDDVLTLINGVWRPVCDDTPGAVSFTNLSDVALGSLQTSNIVQVSGFSCGAIQVTIADGGLGGTPEFRICDDVSCTTVDHDWGSTNEYIDSNQYLQFRLTADSVQMKRRKAVVTLGSSAITWSVDTLDSGGPGVLKRFFVTSATYLPNFGSVTDADSICQVHAESVGLVGTFYAWIASDGTDDPATRFTQSANPYYNVDGDVIANDWADLIDGALTATNSQFRVDETSVERASLHQSWSNVQTNGVVAGTTDCNNWTSASSAYSGNTGRDWSDSTWTNNSSQSCQSQSRFLCFQQ